MLPNMLSFDKPLFHSPVCLRLVSQNGMRLSLGLGPGLGQSRPEHVELPLALFSLCGPGISCVVCGSRVRVDWFFRTLLLLLLASQNVFLASFSLVLLFHARFVVRFVCAESTFTYYISMIDL